MPKCKNCGADVKEGDLFCGFCGKRIETAPEIPAQPIPQPQLQQAAYAKEAMAQAQQPQAAQAAQPVILEKVTLRSPLGEVKSVSTGFCGWMVPFGPLVCLYRRDFKMFFILFIINVVASYVCPFIVGFILAYLGYGVIVSVARLSSTLGVCTSVIIAAFKYNKIYIKGLLSKGWQPLGPNDAYTLRQKGIMI